MATFYAASKGVVEEVRERIQNLTPTYDPSTRFHSLGDDPEAQLYDIDELEIQPRQFDIGPAYNEEMTSLGTSTLGEKNLHDITIKYPGAGTEQWRAAAAGDARQIKSDLHVNPTGTTGIQQRRIDPNSQTIIEESDDDDAITLTLTLMVHYEYTG